MKFTAIASLAVVSVSANGNAIFDEFPDDCASGACPTGVCCKFSDGDENNLDRCMTDAQMGGVFVGTYEDDQQTPFDWTCPEAPAEEGSSFMKASMFASAAISAIYFA